MTEWGVQYEDPSQIRMDGVISTVTVTVGSEELARKAVTWDHSPWDRKQNIRVVRREVTEWVEVTP